LASVPLTVNSGVWTLAKRFFGAVHQQRLRRSANADQGCGAERLFDHLHDAVAERLVEDVNVGTDDLAAEDAGVQRVWQ
jgi:hypothetical protein